MIYKNKSVILIKNKRNKYSLIYPIRVYIRIFVAHIYELGVIINKSKTYEFRTK